MPMRRVVGLVVVALSVLALSACGEKKKDAPAKIDVAGACECAVACAENTTVDDAQGLTRCQQECQKKFGAGAMVEGLKRAMEVFSKAREGCED
jgi:hypothetical protein